MESLSGLGGLGGQRTCVEKPIFINSLYFIHHKFVFPLHSFFEKIDS